MMSRVNAALSSLVLFASNRLKHQLWKWLTRHYGVSDRLVYGNGSSIWIRSRGMDVTIPKLWYRLLRFAERGDLCNTFCLLWLLVGKRKLRPDYIQHTATRYAANVRHVAKNGYPPIDWRETTEQHWLREIKYRL